MTFKVIVIGFEPYLLDVETLDDLQSLADQYSWGTLTINFREMTVTIE